MEKNSQSDNPIRIQCELDIEKIIISFALEMDRNTYHKIAKGSREILPINKIGGTKKSVNYY
jgi:hypothetical protein